MKKLSFLTILIFTVMASTMIYAADKEVQLPPPQLKGDKSLEQSLNERRSIRMFENKAVTLSALSQLLWAAQGITEAKSGHRTAPSAMALYPLEVYVLAGNVKGLEPGIYHYKPKGHMLEKKSSGDRRHEFVEKAVKQTWVSDTALQILITGDSSRMIKIMKQDAATKFTYVEAGLAAQNVLLQVTALGLGSTYVGGFDPGCVEKIFDLPASEEVLAVLPVGVVKK
jgi:SagB-type dehydrogenase family enzyme